MRRGGGGNRRRGPPSDPMQCLGGTPHVSPSGYDWRGGVHRSGVAIPSGSDIRVPPRALSAAKQGEAERPGAAGAPAGAEEGYSVPTRPVGTRTITAFPSGSDRTEPYGTWHGVKHERGAASHMGDSASFVRTGSAEKLSLPRRTQPESAHARGRRQPDRG